MYDDAQEILNYLPIRRNLLENEYIEHLWNTFLTLDSSDAASRPFMVMPFHLLFMLSLQYKVLRISIERNRDYKQAFTIENLHDDQKCCLSPSSVFQLALLNESKMIDLFKLIDLPIEKVKEIKLLVRNRNDRLAHAKGSIETDPEGKIDQYIEALRSLQNYIIPLNDKLKNEWIRDYDVENFVDEYLEVKYLENYFCPADVSIENIS